MQLKQTKPWGMVQKLAEAYSNVSFATLYGNANEDLKHVFRDRLGTKVTPTFFFYRNGAFQSSLHAEEAITFD